jgi:hypothetical protein
MSWSFYHRLLVTIATIMCAAALALGPPLPARSQQTEDPPWADPGPYVGDGFDGSALNSFGADQPIVATYFFYWFDTATLRASGERFPFNPVDDDRQSFLDPDWYARQFSDMVDAGVDVVLPDYWGEPGQVDRRVAPAPDRNLFATLGLPPMVLALERVEEAGRPLKVGLFFDTQILQNADLTTDAGKRIFYVTIRDYFSRIPPRFWAAIDGRPIVWLYDAQRVAAFDQSTFDYVYEHFPQDFGGLRPYIVREWQWKDSKNVVPETPLQTEGLYGWGAAPFGFNPDPALTVAAVGPGFTSNEGGAFRVETPRRNGDYYRENLTRAVQSGRKILAIETWNELDEGTGILETREFGRQYIEITRLSA